MTSFVRSTGINYDQLHHLKSFLPCSQRLSSRFVNHASLPKPLQLASLDIQNLNALGRKKKRLEAYMNALLRSGNTVYANIIKLPSLLLFIMIYDIKDQVNTNKSQEESKAIERLSPTQSIVIAMLKDCQK